MTDGVRLSLTTLRYMREFVEQFLETYGNVGMPPGMQNRSLVAKAQLLLPCLRAVEAVKMWEADSD